jgi:hypothetical protein
MGLLQQLFAICQPSFFGDVDLLPSLKELDAFAAFPFGVQLPSADLFRRTIVVYGVNGANSCSPMCRCAPHGDKSANAQSQYVKIIAFSAVLLILYFTLRYSNQQIDLFGRPNRAIICRYFEMLAVGSSQLAKAPRRRARGAGRPAVGSNVGNDKKMSLSY